MMIMGSNLLLAEPPAKLPWRRALQAHGLGLVDDCACAAFILCTPINEAPPTWFGSSG